MDTHSTTLRIGFDPATPTRFAMVVCTMEGERRDDFYFQIWENADNRVTPLLATEQLGSRAYCIRQFDIWTGDFETTNEVTK